MARRSLVAAVVLTTGLLLGPGAPRPVAAVGPTWTEDAMGASPPELQRHAMARIDQDRVVLFGGIARFDIVGPAGSAGPGKDGFGSRTLVLPNGNIAVGDPGWDDGGTADVGAVYLYDGDTLQLISTLRGSTADDRVGERLVLLPDSGDFVVSSPQWDNGGATDAGAVTQVDGATGLDAVVSAANSLVGSTSGDRVSSAGVTVLSTGNYVVVSPLWDLGGTQNAGAVTFMDAASPIVGVVTAANSLHGTSADDYVGGICNDPTNLLGACNGVRFKSQSGTTGYTIQGGHYTVSSPFWSNGGEDNAGASTWGSGLTGITGAVSVTNSIVGSHAGDLVGGGQDAGDVVVLQNGNYVLRSPNWSNVTMSGGNGEGAVTWVNGANGRDKDGAFGPVTPANSLIGGAENDHVGGRGITALTNGNYVSYGFAWSDCRGHATWHSGTAGTPVGIVDASNSLVGGTARTMGNCGGSDGDEVGIDFVHALSDGDYVVASSKWNDGTAGDHVGAATWGDGGSGIVGTVAVTNSLHGTTAGDGVGYKVQALVGNGNYVVGSLTWDGPGAVDAGAATWGDSDGIVGAVTASNSLVGSTAGDGVGTTPWALANGNYAVASPQWDGAVVNAGAVTWVDGSNGRASGEAGPGAVVSTSNSLVGSTTNDTVGSNGFGGSSTSRLPNGNYVVVSPNWDLAGTANVGAVTWVDGTNGHPHGESAAGVAVSTANSLHGTATNDRVGNVATSALDITTLDDSNYVVTSANWSANKGAVTWGDGAAGTAGAVSAANSMVGKTVAEMIPSSSVQELGGGAYSVDVNLTATRIGAGIWSWATPGNVGHVAEPLTVFGLTPAAPAVSAEIEAGALTYSPLLDQLAVGRHADDIVTVVRAPQDKTWVYQLSSGTWSQDTTGTPPPARFDHAMAYFGSGNQALMFGGNNGRWLGDTWIYEAYGGGWTQVVGSPSPSARSGHAMAHVGDDKVLLFGGANDAGLLGDTWLFDQSDGTWTQLAPSGSPSAREFASMASVGDDKVVLFGGTTAGGANGETWVFDLSDNTWTQDTGMPSPTARAQHSMAYAGGDQALLFGGLDGGGVSDETWLYDAGGGGWALQAPAPSPSPRRLQRAAYIGGDQVLLFGGEESGPSWTQGDTWLFAPEDGGSVQVSRFEARRAGRAVVLEWETASEIKHAGFRVLREEADGRLTVLTERLIPPAAPGGEIGGARYAFTDEAAPRAATRYWLEDVDTVGRATRHGPATAAALPPAPLYLPLLPGGGPGAATGRQPYGAVPAPIDAEVTR